MGIDNVVSIDLSNPNRLYQEVGLQLQTRISQGEFDIGDRLPPERDIAQAFNVSRSVVREAIIMLELQGLVEVRKGSGVYITHLPQDNGDDEQRSNDVGPFELLQARQVIESQIVSFAANNITKSDISLLREYLEKDRISLENNLDEDDYDFDKLFHLTIAKASQNSVLSDIVYDFWRRREQSPMWQQLHTHIHDNQYRYRWIDDHEKILHALQRRDPELARNAMWAHIEHVKDTLFELSDVDDPEFDGFLFR
ncbi:FCD domain-containing protein [Vibrio palustris]|uniref:HTH-type transcriptional regulator LutR n=1 Tax=Vibrio palustris TaxID=1918946 RepID=A0A1R4B524_9VIBR|nr:FCD domain-containing protein [Vibrio palustris]SJL84017.1 HTH-type transcriptional regulator LutR [Vibrio palustris]